MLIYVSCVLSHVFTLILAIALVNSSGRSDSSHSSGEQFWKVWPWSVLRVFHFMPEPASCPKASLSSTVWRHSPPHSRLQPGGLGELKSLGAALKRERMLLIDKCFFFLSLLQKNSETKFSKNLEKFLYYVTINSNEPLDNTTLFCLDLLSPFSLFISLFCILGSWDQIPKKNVSIFVLDSAFKNNLD